MRASANPFPTLTRGAWASGRRAGHSHGACNVRPDSARVQVPAAACGDRPVPRSSRWIRRTLRAPCEPVLRLAQAPGVRRRAGVAQGAHISGRARSNPGTAPAKQRVRSRTPGRSVPRKARGPGTCVPGPRGKLESLQSLTCPNPCGSA